METECSDVCDVVIEKLRNLGFDVYKDRDDWHTDYDKVVKALQDEVILTKRKIDCKDRRDVERMIAIRLSQAIALATHIEDGAEPEGPYVDEKTKTFPVLDHRNRGIFEEIVTLLNTRYGVDIPYHDRW